MKINWYLQGYGVLLFACGYMAILILMAILGFLFDSSNLASVIYFVGTLASLYGVTGRLRIFNEQIIF